MSELLATASTWLSWTWRSFVYIIGWSAARSTAALTVLAVPLLARGNSVGAAGGRHVRMCLLRRVHLLRRLRYVRALRVASVLMMLVVMVHDAQPIIRR